MKLSKRDKVVELVGLSGQNALFADGYDDAIIGVELDYEPRVVYDQNKIIDILMADGMTDEEAQEFFDFNIAGSYVGQQTPIYVQKV
tara:strand:+ start:4126 stop:4386 length:261 start_codon:yes stop_codon:yes gene_type:complete